jgi:predicted lactoylglutathione lyase
MSDLVKMNLEVQVIPVSDVDRAKAFYERLGWRPPFPVEMRQPGPDPARARYGSFCSFSDPDGNTWIVQEVTTRAPGRE